MEWIQKIIAELNNYAGLFSLLAVVVAIIGIYVSVRIHRKKAEEEFLQLQDELDEMERLRIVAWPSDVKDKLTRQHVLKEAIKRGRK
ncbi:MAG: hypothetical protein U0L62_06260 [Paludibacteraceae bacterium]|nr:hypothetical protein [Paludibacteraceae bacterium]